MIEINEWASREKKPSNTRARLDHEHRSQTLFQQSRRCRHERTKHISQAVWLINAAQLTVNSVAQVRVIVVTKLLHYSHNIVGA